MSHALVGIYWISILAIKLVLLVHAVDFKTTVGKHERVGLAELLNKDVNVRDCLIWCRFVGQADDQDLAKDLHENDR